MRESRILIFISFILFIILWPIYYLLCTKYPNLLNFEDVITNIWCGIIVTLITSICQYISAREKIINEIYIYYFDIFRTYYYSKKGYCLFHYNSINVYKKLVELNPKIFASLDNYHGIFNKKDKVYKKLNPSINFENNYSGLDMKKSLVCYFNKKYFEKFFDPFMKEVENILKSISNNRFENDKKEMIRMHDYVWKKPNN